MNAPTVNKAVKISRLLKKILTENISVSARLDKTLSMLAENLAADAATCHLVVDDNYLELFATHAFDADDTHPTMLRIGDGLIGDIAKSKCTRSLDDISQHSDMLSQSEQSGLIYKSFLGVPFVRWGRAIGVFCFYRKDVQEFTATEREAAETAALAFADWAGSDEMRTYKTEFVKSRGQTPTDKYKGLSLSRGFGVGPVIVHRRRQVVTKILADDKQAELARFTAAHTRMNQDLDDKFNASKLGIGEHADILETYRMLARDKGWYNKIAGHVEAGLTAEAAVERAFEDMWNRLSGTQDVYLKERLHDLRDVADRLLNYLSGDDGNIKSADLKELVIVAQTMGPADLMDYDYHKIRALILEDGTPTMHVAIVAKALGIPAVSKIKGIFKEIHNGEMVAVNGDEGLVYIRPSDKILADFRAKIAAREQQIQQMATLRKLAPRTKDKHRINMYINVGLDFDLEYIDSTNCDGIGLYRTEIPFMAAEKMPDVESQRSHYRKLFDKAGERKVVFRSLDVGSDKLLPYWAYSGEENPAIGWRSIRITLDRRAILRQQMRAFIRAAAGKELNVMFPMIANLAEFRDAKETLMLELEKEKRRSDSIPTKVNVGLMIEVPSVVFQLEAVLKEADFISVGTNDLAQFTFACDRTNNRLADRYDVLSVPFLRILKEIITQADKAKVLCSVCGEMASNPIEAMVLIGLGFRNLSCAGSAFGKVKKMIRSVDTRELADYVSTLLEFNQRTLRPQLIAYAHDHGIEIF